MVHVIIIKYIGILIKLIKNVLDFIMEVVMEIKINFNQENFCEMNCKMTKEEKKNCFKFTKTLYAFNGLWN